MGIGGFILPTHTAPQINCPAGMKTILPLIEQRDRDGGVLGGQECPHPFRRILANTFYNAAELLAAVLRPFVGAGCRQIGESLGSGNQQLPAADGKLLGRLKDIKVF